MLWLLTAKTLFCLTKHTYKIIKRNETRSPFLGGGGWLEDGQVHSLAQFVCTERAFLVNGCMIVCMILS